jgi:antitoxin ParD1/3/4
MDIKLTPALEKLIRDRIESGRYLDESDVVRDALRRLDDWERMEEAELDSLRAEIDEGLADFAAGKGVETICDEQLRKFFPNLK